MKKHVVTIILLISLLFCSLIGCNTAEPEQNETPVQPTSDEVYFKLSKDSEDGYATLYIPTGRTAKVLLLTDPQLDPTEKYSIVGSKNDLTIVFLEKLLSATNPDLVIVAGDIAMTTVLNNWSYFCQIADVFEEKQVPWSFISGNHDCENEYVLSMAGKASLLGQLTKEKLLTNLQETYNYCLAYSDYSSETTYGSHVINIRNTDGKLLNTFCNIDCEYSGETYSRVISDELCDWYKEVITDISKNEGVDVVPSIVNTHVALPEAFISWKASFTNGEPNEHYNYGHLLEGDYSKYASKSNFFETLLEVGSTKAVFFGHHHSNDASTEYQGIDLTFIQHSGMSHEYRTTHTGSFALTGWTNDTVFDFSEIDTYGDQRGGVMVTINQDATYDYAPVYAAEVIEDYSSWAINYDTAAQELINARGSDAVIRGK